YPEQARGAQRRGADRLQRRHAEAHHARELARVLAVRVHAGVGAERDGHAGLVRAAEVIALDAAGAALLLQRLGQDAGLLALAEDELGVVDVHHQHRAVLLRQGDPGVVDEAGVLDRIHARFQRVADAAGAMRVRGDLATMAVRLLDQRAQLLHGVLRCADLGALGQHAAGRTGLDQVDAVFDVAPDLAPHFPGTVSHALALRLAFERQQVVVRAVAAGDADRRAGGDDPRPIDHAV